MTSPIHYLTQGLRIYRNSLNLKKHGFHQYDGNAKAICTQIVSDCWNGRYFQTSTTNFAQFWTRDFGWCTESLLKLGYKNEVNQTLSYALNTFSKHDKVTTTITPNNQPFDFPTHAVDSLPWLVHSLSLAKKKELTERYQPFIESETQRFVKTVINPETGLVKPLHFSSIKDFAIRKSSCYDNCMVALLSTSLNNLKLNNPLHQFNYPQLIKETFWNGEYFYDDLKKLPYVAADANIFPFYLKIIKSKSMLKSAINEIKKAQLDIPLPIKYTRTSAPVKFLWQELFMKNYERDAIWTHMGPLYIQLLKQINKSEAYRHVQNYTHLIETYKNYPEVLDSNGKPFTSIFYHSDQGMLWAANYLTL
jgi:hypothetical protein